MNANNLESPERKLVMWYKCKEKSALGLTKAQISRSLGLDVKTVRKYLSMSYDEFKSSESYKRMYVRILDPYESKVYEWLDQQPDLSASQVHDWLRERYPYLPDVNSKTVYNYVKFIRTKYNIAKPSVTSPRQYAPIEETAYGEYAQVDFGEMWMRRGDHRKLKVYFFVMVLCRSRKKYVWFSQTPFTTALAIYAHEKAFEYFGGKPKKIIYDQDAVLIHSENLGDYILTKSFNAYVNQAHFDCIFCRKSDPESKGKVESAVKYVKYNFLRGRKFVNIEQLNEEGVRWLSRTANGLPHNTTKLVPDEVFKEEVSHLTPYVGKPSMPERSMQTYKVQKTNSFSYHGNRYSLPSGSYSDENSKVWVNVEGNMLEAYNMETGKRIATHVISDDKGRYILDSSHRKVQLVSSSKRETSILEYCNYDRLAKLWLDNLKEDKPRYYKSNLDKLASEMRHFDPSTLHAAFERSLDCGMYNAKDFISLCERIGKRMPIRDTDPSLVNRLPETIKETPEKTNINQYSQYFS